MADEPRWKPALDLLSDLTLPQNREDALEKLADDVLDLVPADLGSALFTVKRGLPRCIRWPEYSTSRVPQFNSYYNRIIPIQTDPGDPALGPVNWRQYAHSEYVSDFHEPLGIRKSVGAAFEDRFTGSRYIIWIHRNASNSHFRAKEVATFRAFCASAAEIISLRSEIDALKDRRLCDPELGPDADILSPREAEVARLICRRLSMREIATILGLSPRTVERHALHIYRKLNVACRRELAKLLLNGYRRGNE